jgi:tetratricopeptide (TPR) repeat protein
VSGVEFVQRGKVLIVKKQFQDAVRVCRLGLLAHPTLVEGRLVLGMALMALDRFDEVLAEMRVALELDKQSPLGTLLKGEALLRKGDLRQAGEVLERARQLDPLNDKVTQLLAEVKAGRAVAPRPGAPAPPTFGGDQTRAYPAAPPRGGAAKGSPAPLPAPLPAPSRSPISPGAGVGAGSSSAGGAGRDDRPKAVSGAITASMLPTPDMFGIGDSSATIVLESKDLGYDEDSGGDAVEVTSRDALGADEIIDSDDEDSESGVETDTRRAAAGGFEGPDTEEDDEPVPTTERRRREAPPRPLAAAPRALGPGVVESASTGDVELVEQDELDQLVALVAAGDEDARVGADDPSEATTGGQMIGGGLRGLGPPPAKGALPVALVPAPPILATPAPDAVEALIEPDDFDEPSQREDYDEGRARQRRISRALSDPGPRGRGASDRPGDGGPTRPAKPAARRTDVVPSPPPRTDFAVAADVDGEDDDVVSSAEPPLARRMPLPAKSDTVPPNLTEPRSARASAPPPLSPRLPPAGQAPPAEVALPLSRSMPLSRSAPRASEPPLAKGGAKSAPPAPANARSEARPSSPPALGRAGPRRSEPPPGARPAPRPSPPPVRPPPRPSDPPSGTRSARPSNPPPGNADATQAVLDRRRADTAAVRGFRPWVYGVIAFVVVVGAVVAGLFVREQRIRQRMRELADQAVVMSAAQTYRAYVQAEGNFRAILQQRDDVAARAGLARVRAAAAAEFGDPLDEALALVSGLSSDRGRDSAAARVYVALAQHDGDAAVRAGRTLVATFDKDAEAHYLLGRALLLQDDAAAAADELAKALAIRPAPLTLVALALAEVQRGQPGAATRAITQALELAPGHPTATIEGARLWAQTAKLPLEGGGPEAELTTLLGDGAKAPPDQPPLLSRAQIGWASLALAEVKLARGDTPGARGALAAAAESRPSDDRRFCEGLVHAYLEAGDLTAARVEAERAAATWPRRGEPRVWLALVALGEGKPEAALAAHEQAGAAGASPAALAVRGQARLLLGDLEGAGRDLDEALAARPGDRRARVARAAVDLGRGDPKAALGRLEPLYLERPDPEVGVGLGAALRFGGGDRVRARQVLEAAVASPRGRAGWLELARLDRDEGRWDEAASAYARAIEISPRAADARLEAATLAYDRGDARGARESIDRLVQDVPTFVDALFECARLHVAVGDPVGAERCLVAADAAARAPAHKARGLRERGRLALARRDAAAAAAELGKVAADDLEGRVLYTEALLLLDDVTAAEAQVTAFEKAAPGRAEPLLARGRLLLALGRSAPAAQVFAAADKLLGDRKAPPRLLADARGWLGRALYFDGNLPKAKAVLEEAARLDPSNAEVQFTLGLLLYDQKQVAPARAAFQRAVEQNPVHADAWFYLGDTARKLGDKVKARLAFKTYLEIAPKGDLVAEIRRLMP